MCLCALSDMTDGQAQAACTAEQLEIEKCATQLLKIKYIAAGEQDQLVRCSDPDALEKKVNELKQLGTVASIQTFAPVAKLKRTIVWEIAADDETTTKRIEG